MAIFFSKEHFATAIIAYAFKKTNINVARIVVREALVSIFIIDQEPFFHLIYALTLAFASLFDVFVQFRSEPDASWADDHQHSH